MLTLQIRKWFLFRNEWDVSRVRVFRFAKQFRSVWSVRNLERQLHLERFLFPCLRGIQQWSANKFMFATILSPKSCTINVVDARTAFSETDIVCGRFADSTMDLLETIWIHRYEAQSAFSADMEFTKVLVRKFSLSYNIIVKDKTVRRHDNTGIVEWKQLTVRKIFKRLQLDNPRKSDVVLLSRETVFSNLFSGSQRLSSFDWSMVIPIVF